MDPMESFRSVWRWLRELGVYPVSCFVFLRIFVVDALDLELHRFNLDPTMSPSLSNESNDSV